MLVRLFEFVKANVDISEQELEFTLTVGDIFHYPADEFELLKQFVLSDFDMMPSSARLLLIDGEKTTDHPEVRHLYQESLLDKLWVIYFKPADMYMVRGFGKHEL